METLKFNTLKEAENSETFETGKFHRLIFNHRTKEFCLEILDFGTILTHQSLLSFGKDR